VDIQWVNIEWPQVYVDRCVDNNMAWAYCERCGKVLANGECTNGACEELGGVIIPETIGERLDSIFQYGLRFTVEKNTFDIMNERAIEEKMRLVIANPPTSSNYEYLQKMGPPMSVQRAKRLIQILEGLMKHQSQSSRVWNDRRKWIEHVRKNYIRNS